MKFAEDSDTQLGAVTQKQAQLTSRPMLGHLFGCRGASQQHDKWWRVIQ
jgi:hypothetical protein